MESELCRVQSGKQNPHQVIQWRGFNMRNCLQRHLKRQRSKQWGDWKSGTVRNHSHPWGWMDKERSLRVEAARRLWGPTGRVAWRLLESQSGHSHAHRCYQKLRERRGEIPWLLPSSHPPVSCQTLPLSKPKQNQGSLRSLFFKDQNLDQSRAGKLRECSQEEVEND